MRISKQKRCWRKTRWYFWSGMFSFENYRILFLQVLSAGASQKHWQRRASENFVLPQTRNPFPLFPSRGRAKRAVCAQGRETGGGCACVRAPAGQPGSRAYCISRIGPGRAQHAAPCPRPPPPAVPGVALLERSGGARLPPAARRGKAATGERRGGIKWFLKIIIKKKKKT